MKMRMKMHLGKRNVPRLLKWFILLSLLSYTIYLVNRILSFHLVVNSVVYLTNDDSHPATGHKLMRSTDPLERPDKFKLHQSDRSRVITSANSERQTNSSVQNIFLRYGDDHNLFFALPKPDNYIGHPTRFNRRLLLDPNLLKSRYNVTYSMIVHHLRFNYKELNEIMPKDTFYLTILRDPVKLYESLFTYFDFSQSFLGKNITLSQFINLYRSHLALESDYDDDEGDEKNIQRQVYRKPENTSTSINSVQSVNVQRTALNVINSDESDDTVNALTKSTLLSTDTSTVSISNTLHGNHFTDNRNTDQSTSTHLPHPHQRHLQGNNAMAPTQAATDDQRDTNRKLPSVEITKSTHQANVNTHTDTRKTSAISGTANQIRKAKVNGQVSSRDQSGRINQHDTTLEPSTPHTIMLNRVKKGSKMTRGKEGDNSPDKSSSSAFLPYLTELFKPFWSREEKTTVNRRAPDMNRRIRGRYGRNQMAFDLGFNPRYFDKKQFVNNFIDALDSIFHLVMINEKMDESLILLKHLLCWSVDDVISFEHNRRSPEYALKQPITGENEKIIRSLNYADQLIYNHFYNKLNQMIEAFGVERMALEVNELRDKRNVLYKKCVQSTDLMSNIVPQQSSIVKKYHSTVKNNTRSSAFTHAITGKKINPLWASPKVLGMKVNPNTDQNKLCTQLTMRELTYTAKLRKKQGQLLSSKKLLLSGFNVKLEVLAQNQVDYYFRN